MIIWMYIIYGLTIITTAIVSYKQFSQYDILMVDGEPYLIKKE